MNTERQQPCRLFATRDLVRSAKVMQALDAVNARYGRGTLRPLATGIARPWATGTTGYPSAIPPGLRRSWSPRLGDKAGAGAMLPLTVPFKASIRSRPSPI